MGRIQSAYLQAGVVIVAILQPLKYYILRTKPVNLLKNEKFQLYQVCYNFIAGCLTGKIYNHVDYNDDDHDADGHDHGHDRTDLIIK